MKINRDVTEFNDALGEAEISEETAANMMKTFHKLKIDNQDKAIIEASNKVKFVTIMKMTGQKLEKYNLSKEDFSNLDFSDFIFSDCNFEYTNFQNSNMDAVEFTYCCLDHAVFHKAMMECACFRHCSCREADFSDSHLLASYMEDSDWRKANVCGANMLEIEAHNWNVEDMVINKNTSVGEGEFSNVEWSKTNVTNLNISLDQVKYFLQSTNGGKFLNVYTNYKKSSFEQKEDAILEALLNDKDIYMENAAGKYTKEPLIFISYASEQESVVKDFYNTQKYNFPLWMDIELKKQEQLRTQVETIINSCSKAVIFLSKEYIVKAWTRYELYRLFEESRKRDLKIYLLLVSSEAAGLAGDMLKKESSIIVINTVDELIHML